MSREPSWCEVTQALAERLSFHAYCDTHPAPAADPDNCPFCADRDAYRIWEAKAGHVPPAPDPTSRRLALADVPYNDSMLKGNAS